MIRTTTVLVLSLLVTGCAIDSSEESVETTLGESEATATPTTDDVGAFHQAGAQERKGNSYTERRRIKLNSERIGPRIEHTIIAR